MGLAAAERGAKYPGEAGPIIRPPRHIHTAAASFSSPLSLVWRADSDATTKEASVGRSEEQDDDAGQCGSDSLVCFVTMIRPHVRG